MPCLHCLLHQLFNSRIDVDDIVIMCSREIFTKKCGQQQIFDSDLKGAWRYNHVTFTPIAKNFILYCRLIYMLSILCVKLTIKVKVGDTRELQSRLVPPKKTGSSHLKAVGDTNQFLIHKAKFCLYCIF